MSRSYLTLLSGIVAVIFAARFTLAALPLRRIAVRVSMTDAALIGGGVAGLAFHCGAMFYRRTAERLPYTHSVIRAINAMGTASRLWYIVPAVMVMIGLRRQYPLAVVAVAATLATVGATMYDHGALRTHLTAIFIAVVTLAIVACTLVLPPQRNASRRSVERPAR